MGNANLGQVSLFLSLLGVSNVVFMWVIFVILYATGVEYFLAEDIPWSDLNASNILGLGKHRDEAVYVPIVYASRMSQMLKMFSVFNFTINFGVAYTYPLFISVAMLLGIPLNAGSTYIYAQHFVGSPKIEGQTTATIRY